MSEERHSIADVAPVLTDEDEIARREAENGLKQFGLAVEINRNHVKDEERPFRLRSFIILQLHSAALEGLHPLAGTFRNTPVKIGGSKHKPPEAAMVAEEVEHLCQYVNDNWDKASAEHLAAYVLWRLNWIHAFADGNGRTARAVSYVVMNIKMQGLLPGTPTIPDQIASDKKPYYAALEKADEALVDHQKIDVTAFEDMLHGMLATQLLASVKEAKGRA